MNKAFCSLILFFLFGCSNQSDENFTLPDNAQSLISSDSSKTWKIARRFNNGTRMNMGDCFLAHRQTFSSSNTFTTSSSGRSDCGNDMSGKWSLARDENGTAYIKLESEQIPEMLNIKDDFKYFRIKALSDTLMVLQFNHAQTTKKTTTLVDYFVPEGVKVDDREFHW
ncbi:lipocalin family protein [Ekhidna sp.]